VSEKVGRVGAPRASYWATASTRLAAEGKLMKIGLHGAGWLLLVAALTGCKTEPFCDALGKCGGDFLAGAATAKWGATAVDACVDQVPNPVDPPSLALLPPRPAGVRPVEPSTTDWCAGLVLSSDGQGSYKVASFDDGWVETLKKYNGWFPSIPLFTAELDISNNNEYSLTTTQLASQRVDLSANCLFAQGISLSCGDMSTLLATFVDEKLNGKKMATGKGTPLLPGLTAVVYDQACGATSDGGCSCGYNVSITTTTTGPWANGSGTLTFFDAGAAAPSQADYCVSGGQLQLTGSKETDLFNRTSLKTLTLRAQ